MGPRAQLLAGLFLSGLTLERFFPLRAVTAPKLPRLLTNLGLAAFSLLFMRLTCFPLVMALSLKVSRESWGLRGLLDLPPVLETALALVALDYTLYFWHLLNHKIPFLWRFHNIHHIDLDLDVTTASRFHFGELALSAGYRAGQIILFGIDPFTLVVFETVVTASALFHHSNLRLPLSAERLLNALIVTPRMHGIHHSIVEGETNSNYCAILSCWDRLHGSLVLNVRQSQITIGVPAYRDPRETTFLNSLILPFRPQRSWNLPDGTRPRREVLTDI